MRVASLLILSLWTAAVPAQAMYKCVDDRRQVTYSNIVCEKQGLKDAGPVAERTTSMPFAAPPKPAPRAEPAKPPAAKDEAEAGRGAAQVKPASPLIEKLTR